MEVPHTNLPGPHPTTPIKVSIVSECYLSNRVQGNAIRGKHYIGDEDGAVSYRAPPPGPLSTPQRPLETRCSCHVSLKTRSDTRQRRLTPALTCPFSTWPMWVAPPRNSSNHEVPHPHFHAHLCTFQDREPNCHQPQLRIGGLTTCPTPTTSKDGGPSPLTK
ncbi:hypothetical protein NDU88_004701 [Pleurodeles waltl]|uniref:Uncharacterized protein n=1 Tax=Pleurodeles waltl TaxID=8319 RepID=A0AAV7MVW4_PLEWA|nr:hypothetical protein NDU88_004701 [Pleurodeles waltl]